MSNFNHYQSEIQKERARIQAIDAIAANIDPQLVHEAKYGPNRMTAEELAMKAMVSGRMIMGGVVLPSTPYISAQNTGSAPQFAANGERIFDLSNMADVNEVFRILDQEHEAAWTQRVQNAHMRMMPGL